MVVARKFSSRCQPGFQARLLPGFILFAVAVVLAAVSQSLGDRRGQGQVRVVAEHEVVAGTGRFEGPHLLRVTGEEGERTVAFRNAAPFPQPFPILVLGFNSVDNSVVAFEEAIDIDGIVWVEIVE